MVESVLPDLPSDYGALQPHISGEIMELYHSKHHPTSSRARTPPSSSLWRRGSPGSLPTTPRTIMKPAHGNDRRSRKTHRRLRLRICPRHGGREQPQGDDGRSSGWERAGIRAAARRHEADLWWFLARSVYDYRELGADGEMLARRARWSSSSHARVADTPRGVVVSTKRSNPWRHSAGQSSATTSTASTAALS